MMARRGQTIEELAEARFRDAAGVVFRRLRADRGWSLREFAERVGLAHTSLYAVERNEAIPSISTLAAVAEACDLSLPAILSLIVDELARDHPASNRDASLASVVEAAASLTDGQRRELASFAEYLRYRDRPSAEEG
ncbi:MAG TPA: helix-turn-helix transcriptional regulator [Thermomicrobiales bacterium]|nr:helix-turn-helix transcriptional regulator [Thermomicrobiales bacterium]